MPGVRVVALPASTEREKSQMYIQRYIAHFPSAGEVVIFDRSWYNRAGVERVMGFCTEERTNTFLEAAPEVERNMVDSGSCSSSTGRRSALRSKRGGSTNDKKRGRLNIITHLLSRVLYETPTHMEIGLPERQKPRGYKPPDLPLRNIPTRF